jgi:histidyl-tRNA synthetase
MYRPGGFPEYTPKQQKIWDMMIQIVSDVFKKHNYEHIWTPAVESVEILKKGGDIIDQQVYGLYGLAQGVEDTKDYALHFDLTVPLARYVLDHQQELVFPFSKYHIQPVWRGESHKRLRYKEFWQCDIDTIWRSETTV